jgi:uncharacterized membrane protein YcaP (DUF421 family)
LQYPRVTGFPGLGSGPIDIVVRTAVVYVFIVFGLRLGGKREVGQLSIVDLVALLLLSNAVQNAMVGEDTSVVGGLIAAAVILISARILDLLIGHYRNVRKFVVGEPRILVWNGGVLDRALREESISLDELKEALRQHGLIRFSHVKLAVLEVDGSISVIPGPEAAEMFQASAGPGTAGGRRGGRIRSRRGGLAEAPKLNDPPSKANAQPGKK